MSLFHRAFTIGLSSNICSSQTAGGLRGVHRWVWPTLRELKRRKDKMGPQAPTNRATFLEWNYNAELFAFGQRLNEKFNPKLLQQAFVHRSFIVQEELKQEKVGIENPDTNLMDNKTLANDGEKIISDYVEAFIGIHLPAFPVQGVHAIRDYLLSDELLANVSKNLGTTELILSAEFPVERHTLVTTLKAVIGALNASSGQEQAYDFVRDFICTQLNQKDINDLWTIDGPKQMLFDICKARNFGEPEPRLLGTAGKNTLLGTYHVGIYCNKKLLSSGFGENSDIAHEMAVRNSLKKLFGTDNHKPFDYKINANELFKLYNKQEAIRDG